MGLKIKEYEQLTNHIGARAETALEENSRAALREALEEISDLTEEDATLSFNDDGTVSIVPDQESEDEDEDESD
jgi:hypothetical protein